MLSNCSVSNAAVAKCNLNKTNNKAIVSRAFGTSATHTAAPQWRQPTSIGSQLSSARLTLAIVAVGWWVATRRSHQLDGSHCDPPTLIHLATRPCPPSSQHDLYRILIIHSIPIFSAFTTFALPAAPDLFSASFECSWLVLELWWEFRTSKGEGRAILFLLKCMSDYIIHVSGYSIYFKHTSSLSK